LESLRSPLFILVSVQTILVGVLAFRISDLEGRFGPAPSGPPEEARPVLAVAPASAAGLTENEIRAIMRDELSSLKAAFSESAAPPPAAPRTAQSDRAYVDVQQEMRRLIAKGSAGEVEMAALESRIAELPAEQRRQALSQISQAVSNGTLEARF